MPDFFSTQSADIIDKYKSIVSFKEYKHIEDQFFIVNTEAFEEQTSNKAKVEVTEYESTNQVKIDFICFV